VYPVRQQGFRSLSIWMTASGRLAAAAAMLSACLMLRSNANEPNSLYEAVAITTGNDTRYRAKGFDDAFREVAVKVTGEPRLFTDPRIIALGAHADPLISSFQYIDQQPGFRHHDEQGTYDWPFNLIVRFDPTRLDLALAELGEKPWRGERPTVLPVIAVRGLKASYLLSAEAPVGAIQRTSLGNSGDKFGMAVRIPTMAELSEWGVSMERPLPLIESTGNEARVCGKLEFRDTAPIGWTGSWRMRWQKTDYAWSIMGVNFDTAFNNIVAGVVRIASGHGPPD
jgi:hypothetical protein